MSHRARRRRWRGARLIALALVLVGAAIAGRALADLPGSPPSRTREPSLLPMRAPTISATSTTVQSGDPAPSGLVLSNGGSTPSAAPNPPAASAPGPPAAPGTHPAASAPTTPSPTAPPTTAEPSPPTVWTELTIQPTTVVQRGQSVQTNRTRLVMENGGDLAIYDENNLRRWSSGTTGLGYAAVFQDDGNLVVYDQNWNGLWASNTAGYLGAVLVLETDGNLCVVYQGRVIWASNTAH